MLYVVDRKLVYNEKDGKAVPVNVSATRNPLTGRITTHTIEEAGAPVDLPAPGTCDICTVAEVIARFSCAETPYRFPAGSAPAAPAKTPQMLPEGALAAPEEPMTIEERVALRTRADLVAEAKALGIRGLKDANKVTIQTLIDEVKARQ